MDIRCINSDFDITNYNQLKNIKVFAQISTDNFQYEFNLLECLYGEIKIDNEYYVVNSKKFYRIDKSYTEKVDKLYNSLKIYDGLPDRTKPGPESIYNSFVEDSNPTKFKNLDKKLYTISGKSKIELCDLYDIERKAFIHVKKNGGSSVLSHLFQQAQNSAKILCDKNERKRIIDFYKEKTNVNIEYNFQYEIVMAIITNVIFEKNEHINIPFFSKMSVVSAAKEIELMGFNPKIAFIYSSAPLHEKNR